MPNHPNRGARTAASNPEPAAITAAREAAGLTQARAAAVVHANLRSWQKWEGGERNMHPAVFELFMLKTGQWVLEVEARAA